MQLPTFSQFCSSHWTRRSRCMSRNLACLEVVVKSRRSSLPSSMRIDFGWRWRSGLSLCQQEQKVVHRRPSRYRVLLGPVFKLQGISSLVDRAVFKHLAVNT